MKNVTSWVLAGTFTVLNAVGGDLPEIKRVRNLKGNRFYFSWVDSNRNGHLSSPVKVNIAQHDPEAVLANMETLRGGRVTRLLHCLNNQL